MKKSEQYIIRCNEKPDGTPDYAIYRNKQWLMNGITNRARAVDLCIRLFGEKPVSPRDVKNEDDHESK